MKFCEKLIILRKIKGITQDEFASEVGVSRQAVYKWESGQSYPEVAKLIEIKRLFEISIDDLLDENYEISLPEKKKRKRAVAKAENSTVSSESTLNTEESSDAEISHAPVSMPKESEIEVTISEEKITESLVQQNTELEKDDFEKAEEVSVQEPVGEPVVKEEKEESEKAEEKKKVGFFGRLFGRR